MKRKSVNKNKNYKNIYFLFLGFTNYSSLSVLFFFNNISSSNQKKKKEMLE